MTSGDNMTAVADLPVPTGWFQVADSDELAAGEVRPLHYFGKELVAFRTESGEAQVLDAYCAHLGAHLGYGGTVSGECLRCPFHAWSYGTDGKALDIPYAHRVPNGASVRSWPTRERSGVVFVWHDPLGGEPAWPLPDLPDPAAFAEVRRYSYTFRSHPQEFAENTFDFGHGQFVHVDADADGRQLDEAARARVEAAGTGTREGYEFDGHVAALRSPTLVQEHHGLGIGLIELGPADARLLERIAGVTPVDRDTVQVRFTIMLAPGEAAERAAPLFATGILQDIAIWERKVYRPQPQLCDGDGPIMRFRCWAGQFYAS